MLRVYHNQTVEGAILVDDIDDGLPNKTARRLGSTSDPKAYKRDGYANEPKQPCYVPKTQASLGFPLIPGYIDLNETDRVTFSAGKGKIFKLAAAGLVSLVPFDAADIVPTMTLVEFNVPGAGDVTITGTNLDSILPDVTSVVFTGTGAVTLTADQIVTDGGSVSATSIVIDASSVPGIAHGTTSVKVQSNELYTDTLAVTAAPTLASAVLSTDLTLTGTRMVSYSPDVTVITITGDGAVTLTAAEIITDGGTVSATSILIKAVSIPGVATTTSSVQVTANSKDSSVVAVS